MYKIEKNIPIVSGRGRKAKIVTDYPLRHMKVGDSFLVEDKLNKTVASNVYTIAKKMKMKVSTTRLGESKTRVWRIK